MDTDHNTNTAKARTNKTTTTVIIGVITLVKAGQMKNAQNCHGLIITIPKAA